MPIDTVKVAALSDEVNQLEQALAKAQAALQAAVAGGATAPVPQINPATQQKWGSVTDAIMDFASKQAEITAKDAYEYMRANGYRGTQNAVKARMHKLLAEKKLRRVDTGLFKKA
jgi:hypothetical protein